MPHPFQSLAPDDGAGNRNANLRVARRLAAKPGAKSFKVRLVLGERPSADELELSLEVAELTAAELEADQPLCRRVKCGHDIREITCGCDPKGKARVTLRTDSHSNGGRTPTTDVEPHLAPVCCGLSSLHPWPCVFNGLSGSGAPALDEVGGVTSVRVNAGLVNWDPTKSTASGDDEEDQEPNEGLTFGGEPSPQKWQLRTLLIYAYDRAKLNSWPRPQSVGYRCDMVDLLHSLSEIRIGNESKPYGVSNYGALTVIPELISNPGAAIQRKLNARSRPIVIARFEKVAPIHDGRSMQVSFTQIEGVRFIVSSHHWKKLVRAYRDPVVYQRQGLTTLMVFTAARSVSEPDSPDLWMKNLGWIHVTEHNIPIDSPEEGWEIGHFIEQHLAFEKVLKIEKDPVTGRQLPRRDFQVHGSALREFEVELFGMLIGHYVEKIPERSKERGKPLLCIRYEGGKLIRRWWADDALERKYPGGTIPGA